jgi:hypothetical protein
MAPCADGSGHEQDINAGDGTTSVTVLCGALLNKCLMLLDKGVHPTIISDAMNIAAVKACEVRALTLPASPYSMPPPPHPLPPARFAVRRSTAQYGDGVRRAGLYTLNPDRTGASAKVDRRACGAVHRLEGAASTASHCQHRHKRRRGRRGSAAHRAQLAGVGSA